MSTIGIPPSKLCDGTTGIDHIEAAGLFDFELAGALILCRACWIAGSRYGTCMSAAIELQHQERRGECTWPNSTWYRNIELDELRSREPRGSSGGDDRCRRVDMVVRFYTPYQVQSQGGIFLG